jgi:hypothetical protein
MSLKDKKDILVRLKEHYFQNAAVSQGSQRSGYSGATEMKKSDSMGPIFTARTSSLPRPSWHSMQENPELISRNSVPQFEQVFYQQSNYQNNAQNDGQSSLNSQSYEYYQYQNPAVSGQYMNAKDLQNYQQQPNTIGKYANYSVEQSISPQYSAPDVRKAPQTNKDKSNEVRKSIGGPVISEKYTNDTTGYYRPINANIVSTAKNVHSNYARGEDVQLEKTIYDGKPVSEFKDDDKDPIMLKTESFPTEQKKQEIKLTDTLKIKARNLNSMPPVDLLGALDSFQESSNLVGTLSEATNISFKNNDDSNFGREVNEISSNIPEIAKEGSKRLKDTQVEGKDNLHVGQIQPNETVGFNSLPHPSSGENMREIGIEPRKLAQELLETNDREVIGSQDFSGLNSAQHENVGPVNSQHPHSGQNQVFKSSPLSRTHSDGVKLTDTLKEKARVLNSLPPADLLAALDTPYNDIENSYPFETTSTPIDLTVSVDLSEKLQKTNESVNRNSVGEKSHIQEDSGKGNAAEINPHQSIPLTESGKEISPQLSSLPLTELSAEFNVPKSTNEFEDRIDNSPDLHGRELATSNIVKVSQNEELDTDARIEESKPSSSPTALNSGSDSPLLIPVKNSTEPRNLPRQNMSSFDIETEFIKMINEKGFSGAPRKKLLELPIKHKQEMINQYEKEKASKKSGRFKILGFEFSRKNSGNSAKHSTGAVDDAAISDIEVNGTRYTPDSDNEFQLNSPGWFILKLSNRSKIIDFRNLSLKSLSRALQSLKSMLTSGNAEFIGEFISNPISTNDYPSINGIGALEVAMDRMCLPMIQDQDSGKKSWLANNSQSSNRWFSDETLLDEVRTTCVESIGIVMKTELGISAVGRAYGLIKQVFWLFHVPGIDTQSLLLKVPKIRYAYITLLSTIATVFGPACLINEALRRNIMNLFKELQQKQKEPFPFFNLVNSLKNPFMFISSFGKDCELHNLLSYAKIWTHRTALMILINGMVSSAENPEERNTFRKLLDCSGFAELLNVLQKSNATSEFLKQCMVFQEDLESDKPKIVKPISPQVSKATVIEEKITVFDALDSLPDQTLSKHFVSGVLRNLEEMIRRIQEIERNPDRMQEYLGNLLWLVEQSTRALADVVRNFHHTDEESSSLMNLVESEYLPAVERSLQSILPEFVRKEEAEPANIKELQLQLQNVRTKLEESEKLSSRLSKEIELMKISKKRLSGTEIAQISQNELDSSLFKPLDQMVAKDANFLDFFSKLNAKGVDLDTVLRFGGSFGVSDLWNEMQKLSKIICALEKDKFELSTVSKANVTEKIALQGRETLPGEPLPPQEPYPVDANVFDGSEKIIKSELPMKVCKIKVRHFNGLKSLGKRERILFGKNCSWMHIIKIFWMNLSWRNFLMQKNLSQCGQKR